MRPSLTVLSLTLGLALPATLSAQDAEAQRQTAEGHMVQQLQALESALSNSPTQDRAESHPQTPATGAAFLGVQLAMDEGPGVLVAGSLPGHSAAEAGIRAGDRLISIGGSALSNYSELQQTIASMSPGDKVVVLVIRGDKQLELPVTLGTREGDARTAPDANADEALREHLAKMQAWRQDFQGRLEAMARELEAHNAESEAWMGRFDPMGASPQLRRQLDAEWLRRARSAQEVERLRQRLERQQSGQGQVLRGRRALPENLRGLRFHPREEEAEEKAESAEGEERATDQLHRQVDELRASIEDLRRKLAEMER